jgi:hypothetical protein
MEPGMVAFTSTLELEAGRSPVQGQPGLPREILPQKTKAKPNQTQTLMGLRHGSSGRASLLTLYVNQWTNTLSLGSVSRSKTTVLNRF